MRANLEASFEERAWNLKKHRFKQMKSGIRGQYIPVIKIRLKLVQHIAFEGPTAGLSAAAAIA